MQKARDCGLLTDRTFVSSGRQFQAALDALKTCIEAVCRELLRRIGRCQMSQVLND
mgnify:CR=1 FL=1|jgi:hypothetical protein